MNEIEITRGDSPLVLGLPHTGTYLPGDITGLNDTGLALADTDWHIHDLYAGLVDDITTVRTRIHRYAIDANRDPSGESLYPGQNTTTLCPLTDFDGKPLYHPGAEPGPTEIARRKAAYHAPYHAALAAELDRVKAKHGFAILYDCHSIRAHIPFLFDGTLPDFNIGTNGGATCDPRIEAATLEETRASGRTNVLNGRFKGGWTTRQYGRPSEGVHAIQMELAQASHLATETPPFALDPEKSAALRPVLKRALTAIEHLARSGVLAHG